MKMISFECLTRTHRGMQVIQWMQSPVPISAIRDFDEWKAVCTPSGQPGRLDYLSTIPFYTFKLTFLGN